MSSLNTRFASFLRSRTRHNKRRSPYTIKKYQTKLAPFLSKFGHLEPWSLDAEEVEAWFIARQRRYSEATMHMTRACLLAFLNWISAETGLDCALALAYTPKYDPRPERVRPANPHHVQQALELTELLTHSNRPQDRRDACAFVLAASNGQRLSGLMNMRYSTIVDAITTPLFEPNAGTYYVLRTVAKGKRVPVIFGEYPAQVVRNYIEVRPKTKHDRLFVELRPNHKNFGKPLGENGLRGAYRRISQAIGVPNITYQDMRKLKGTQIARQYGLELAAAALGHSISSGTSVVREHYYDPDEAAAVQATLLTFAKLTS